MRNLLQNIRLKLHIYYHDLGKVHPHWCHLHVGAMCLLTSDYQLISIILILILIHFWSMQLISSMENYSMLFFFLKCSSYTLKGVYHGKYWLMPFTASFGQLHVNEWTWLTVVCETDRSSPHGFVLVMLNARVYCGRFVRSRIIPDRPRVGP